MSQDAFIAERMNSDKKETFSEWTYVKFVSAASSLVITIVNSLLIYIVRQFSLGEKHETMTKMNTSVAFKCLILRFINSS